MTTINKQDLVGILKKHGWKIIRQDATHMVLENEDGRRVNAALGANHQGEIGSGLIKTILTATGIAPKEGKSESEMLTQARKKRGKGGNRGHGSGGAKPGTFGHRLFEARVSKGWSQGKLAGMIGSNQMTISGWESGKSSPIAADGHIEFQKQVPRLAMLADIFGWQDILQKTGPPSKAAKAAVVIQSEEPVKAEAPAPVIAAIVTEKVAPGVLELEDELQKLRTRKGDDKMFAKSLIKILKPTDIMEWILDLVNQNRQLQERVDNLLHMETAPEVKRKAALYEQIKAKAEDLVEQMRKLEGE